MISSQILDAVIWLSCMVIVWLSAEWDQLRYGLLLVDGKKVPNVDVGETVVDDALGDSTVTTVTTAIRSMPGKIQC